MCAASAVRVVMVTSPVQWMPVSVSLSSITLGKGHYYSHSFQTLSFSSSSFLKKSLPCEGFGKLITYKANREANVEEEIFFCPGKKGNF